MKGYTHIQYNKEIKAWEKEYGDKKYLNPTPIPKWLKGEVYGKEKDFI